MWTQRPSTVVGKDLCRVSDKSGREFFKNLLFKTTESALAWLKIGKNDLFLHSHHITSYWFYVKSDLSNFHKILTV